MKHYIYISGFGTWQDPLRRLALLRWKSRTSKVTFVPMRWTDEAETYQQKYTRVMNVVELASVEDEIILVGESAGGAMALAIFAQNIERVSSVITICGYNHGSADVGTWYRRRSPAFYEAVQASEQLIAHFSPVALQRITTVYATTDRTVMPRHTIIQGVREVSYKNGGHLHNIARVLVNRLEDAS